MSDGVRRRLCDEVSGGGVVGRGRKETSLTLKQGSCRP